MRYYLDTNIVAFILFDKKLEDNCDKNVCSLLSDYENTFYVSSIAVRELIKLYNDGELKSFKYKSYKDLFSFMEELNYEIKPFTKHHVMTYAELEAIEDHKDHIKDVLNILEIHFRDILIEQRHAAPQNIIKKIHIVQDARQKLHQICNFLLTIEIMLLKLADMASHTKEIS